MASNLVIYRGNCFDGFTAAWAWRYFNGEANTTFHAAQYGEPAPDPAEQKVWILDFSYPREEMKRILQESVQLTVFDHHKTAQANLEGLLQDPRIGASPDDRIVFDMNRSGAGITWDELHKAYIGKCDGGPICEHTRRHWLVEAVEDRDLRRFKQPGTREIIAWLACQPQTFEAWDAVVAAGHDKVVDAGASVLKYINQYGELACAQATEERIRITAVGGAAYIDHWVPCINVPYMNCSDHVNKLLDKNPNALFAVGYFRQAGGKWKFSLRSRPDFDVSEIAKYFGGGGHAQAAGFEAESLHEVFQPPLGRIVY